MYYLMSIYRAPAGNFQVFITKLDAVLSNLFTANTDFILCGDFNVDYIIDSAHKKQLNFLLNSFDLVHVVKFPTRITTATAIDNVFINKSKQNFSVVPTVNGLSDHDAQVLSIRYELCKVKNWSTKIKFRQVNKHTLKQLKSSLETETWDFLLHVSDPNDQYNAFLQIVLLHFEACCPTKTKNIPKQSNKKICG